MGNGEWKSDAGGVAKHFVRLRWVGVSFVALLAAGCSGSDSDVTPIEQRAGLDRLVISCDTAGWIVPCGCTSNQSGGLLRRQAFVNEIAPGGAVVADVGGAAHGVSTYDRLKFEAILRGEIAMGLMAHNLGASELKLGPKYLRELSPELRIKLVSANTRNRQQQPIVAATKTANGNGQQILLVGVVGEEFATDEIEVLPPRQAVLDALAAASGRYDRAVVLAYMNEQALDELAEGLPEVDLVVGGPTGQSVQPHRAGAVKVAAVTNKGKFVAAFEVPKRGEQEWKASIVEMTDRYEDHVEQKENLAAFYKTLADRMLPPSETSFAELLPPSAPADFRVAGNESCLSCHTNDCRDAKHKNTAAQDWTKSKHARAWETLVQKGAHVDAYCQQCHTTGYGLPGGFETAAATPQLTSVGCESCHGPSAAHAKSPKQNRTAYHGQAKSHCAKCHDRENSPEFEYDRYWNALVKGISPHVGDASRASPE